MTTRNAAKHGADTRPKPSDRKSTEQARDAEYELEEETELTSSKNEGFGTREDYIMGRTRRTDTRGAKSGTHQRPTAPSRREKRRGASRQR